MKSTYLKAHPLLAGMAASKLLLGSSSVSAETGSKVDTGSKGSEEVSRLTLNQFATPFELITPPIEAGLFDAPIPGFGGNTVSNPDGAGTGPLAGTQPDVDEPVLVRGDAVDSGTKGGDDGGSSAGTGSKSGLDKAPQRDAGSIWMDALEKMPEGQRARVDFIVGNIRNDQPVDVFLAYSTKRAPQGFGLLQGSLDLDFDSLNILTAVRLSPVETLTSFTAPTAFGEAGSKTRSAILSVALNDLLDASLAENEIYFQAVAFPAGELDLTQAQASEIDHYFIERTDPQRPGSGSKTGDDGSKVTGSGAENTGGSGKLGDSTGLDTQL